MAMIRQFRWALTQSTWTHSIKFTPPTPFEWFASSL